MDMKYQAEQARHKASKKLLKTDMWDVWLTGALLGLAIGTGGGALLDTNADEQVTPQSTEIVASYQQDFNLLAMDYKAAENNAEKGVVLDQTAEKIGQILMDESISESNVETLFDGLSEHMLPPQELVDYKIGNIGDLRECRAEIGAQATAPQVAACTVEAAQDENMLRGFGSDIMFFALLLALAGGTVKMAGRKKLREWSEAAPKRFKH
ncbi:MAG: hypothetical protein EP349_07595 [Alphaproteobacteria bacterium]|nr:MAG: hypothetical protein EP349_07595 [Alphaproteobacteria bacterium]